MDDFTIFIISGKAGTGKTTSANMIKDYLKSKGQNSVVTSYSKYIKMYAKEITTWDGNEEIKPREILQELGGVIRHYLNKKDFFLKRLDEDIDLYKLFAKACVIDDARLPEEIEYFKRKYQRSVISVHIERPNFKTELSEREMTHETEQGLDNYSVYDYTIVNDGTLEDLRIKVYAMTKGMF